MLQRLLFAVLILQTQAQMALYDDNLPIEHLVHEGHDAEEFVESYHLQNIHNEEHEANVHRANNVFAECCNKSGVDQLCAENVCRYAQNPDYVRSALFTFCDIDDDQKISAIFQCMNHDIDLYECCVRWTINHDFILPKHCCRLYMSYPPQRLYFSHTLLRECSDIFEPMMFCPVHYY